MNDHTFLFRQVHPKFIRQGEITSQAFKPTPKDQGKPSVYDGDQIDPEPSWIHYTQVLGRKSAGVVAVTVLECSQAGTQAYVDGVGFPEHAVIDFTGLPSNSMIKNAAKHLTNKARTRGWQYGPTS